jgi:hypothetical protein
MFFMFKFGLPDYYKGDLYGAARKINKMIDPDNFDMCCKVEGEHLVFEGKCDQQMVGVVSEECRDLIMCVTDEEPE